MLTKEYWLEMKIYSLAPRENWICDRFVNEWKLSNPTISTDSIEDANIIWLLADWCWNQIDHRILNVKTVVASVHHITPEKFGAREKAEFALRDQFVDLYHVPCEKTKNQISLYTSKPIWVMPFWVNGSLWYKSAKTKQTIRSMFGIDEDCFLIGSFQRDTEGSDLITPKLEKGPDLFCDAVERFRDDFSKRGKEVRVLLGGWRRQYVMKRLEDAGIYYYYYELPEQSVVNMMYNSLDLYIVAARHEGGPQSIVECACTETPIISTDVGVASMILDSSSIFVPGKELECTYNTQYAKSQVEKYLMPQGFGPFVEMFKQVLK